MVNLVSWLSVIWLLGIGPSEHRPIVVELFTSEGCSSCPPADKLLAEIVKTMPDGVEIIALSEHVDYWDGLGWRDPFSSRQFTERQNRYADHFGPDRVYTPQMIVDGAAELVGSDRAHLMKALAAARAREKAAITMAWRDSQSLDVAVSGAAPASDVMLAITEDGLSIDVKRGENAGRRLPHARVTRELVKLGQTDSAGRFSMAVIAAPKPGWKVDSLRAVVFVQTRGLGPITGAASRLFPAADLLPR
ncbi:MAG: DUF1223 domain-containing protein [Acidobacteria bacterium]|nr:MAG: DUF1223 domain-containing protein [Acidobacteriota bacterium]